MLPETDRQHEAPELLSVKGNGLHHYLVSLSHIFTDSGSNELTKQHMHASKYRRTRTAAITLALVARMEGCKNEMEERTKLHANEIKEYMHSHYPVNDSK
jgi:hypothetical protein